MDDRGTVILEFSIVLPLLFICVWGILAFALYVIESHMLHFAAYTAARVALLESSEAGLDSAARFLATARKEPSWISEGVRELTGRKLSVDKRRQRVDVEVGKEVGLRDRLPGWLGGRGRPGGLMADLAQTFRHQQVFYSMGR